MRYAVNVNGKQFDVQIDRVEAGAPVAVAPVVAAPVAVAPVAAPVMAAPIAVAGGANHEVLSPMPANVFEIKVEVGQKVNEGDLLIILEAMKMEIEVTATETGTIKQILTNVGSSVGAEDVLIVIS